MGNITVGAAMKDLEDGYRNSNAPWWMENITVGEDGYRNSNVGWWMENITVGAAKQL